MLSMDKSGFAITICTNPADALAAKDLSFPLCHLAYSVGKDGRLYRGALGVNITGGLLGVSDSGIDENTPYSPELMRELKRECDARAFSGVLCDFERPPTPSTARFAYESAIYFRSLGMDFYLPEAYASSAPGASLLISSSVTDGACGDFYRNAVFKYGASRVALVFEPVCIDFEMPSPRADGSDRLSPAELDEIMRREKAIPYYSHELTANYFTYRSADGKSRFALFDDSRSMVRKLDAARRAGFREAFVCYPDVVGSHQELSSLLI